jgi:hypothetical protein
MSARQAAIFTRRRGRDPLHERDAAPPRLARAPPVALISAAAGVLAFSSGRLASARYRPPRSADHFLRSPVQRTAVPRHQVSHGEVAVAQAGPKTRAGATPSRSANAPLRVKIEVAISGCRRRARAETVQRA